MELLFFFCYFFGLSDAVFASYIIVMMDLLVDGVV